MWRFTLSRLLGASNASLHLATFVRIRSTGALQTKTRGFWLWLPM